MPPSSAKANSPVPDGEAAREALVTFATAFAFLIVGFSCLVWNSGILAEGRYINVRVIGGLHFLTLGWLSLSIFGALRVFTGVALGREGYGKAIFPWIRRFWTGGTLMFTLGDLLNQRLAMATVGGSLVGALFWVGGLLLHNKITVYLDSSILLVAAVFAFSQIRTLLACPTKSGIPDPLKVLDKGRTV